MLAGSPLDAASFIPLAAMLAPVPEVATLAALLAALAASTPEFAPGRGDLLVTDARSRLPFSTSHTTNPLNHAEALWDPTLQSQVISILSRLRTPTVSGQAVARIHPYPVRNVATTYTVTASDVATGAPVTSGTVRVLDIFDAVALQVALGSPFTFTFRGRRVDVIDSNGDKNTEFLFPSVEADLPPPYGTVEVVLLGGGPR